MQAVPDWPSIRAALKRQDVRLAKTTAPQAIGGGSINAAWRIDGIAGPIFLKTGSPDFADMFSAEAGGLDELRGANAVRVPLVLACGCTAQNSYLALEWLPLERLDGVTERLLGRQLAKLHRYTAERFGWRRDNTIGSTPQRNDWQQDWASFFGRQRLQYQLELAAQNGFGGELQVNGANVLEKLPDILGDHQPLASLLHGDLWGGNAAMSGGQPVIFDPAVYYGDRETDLAMTHLFGGFGETFYECYNASWPLQKGYRRREQLYQLYHVLNHLNLFGRSYLGRAAGLIAGLLDRSG